ncbi:hypothetical protein [Loktanella sp. SALINAS62]|uniref:hypothetical protein n=1 Tax=Loktanella sp. SALINAS62 TaxID=2706124 RepID=UPI001B8BDDA2|nr:hypothetical protein [Loktanella sp. SALINAS62]MBS1303817.1 hypothetical protein [Loktanella sp. SALINAS62]
MDIAQVQDEESLKRYLDALPEDDAVEAVKRILSRTSARYLPMIAIEFAENQHLRASGATAVPFFGAVATSLVANDIKNKRTLESSAYAVASVATAVAEQTATYSSFFQSGRYGNSGFFVAAYAPMACFTSTAKQAIPYAINALNSLVPNRKWSEVNTDLLAKSGDPVWYAKMSGEYRKSWEHVQDVFENDPSADWSFWIAWYERVLSGRDFLAADMAEVLSTLGKDDWDKGPAHINPMFDGVLGLYRAQDADQIIAATPLGEDVTYDEENAVLVLRATDTIEQDYLVDVLGQISSACRLFESSDVARNSFPLTTELRILDEAQTIHRDRPVLILKDVSRVLTRLAKKIAIGDCPSADQDAEIGDFQEILENVQLDLIGLSPEIRAYYQATRPAVPEGDVSLIAEGARAIAQSGDEALAEALTTEAAIIEDTEEDEVARRNALYRIAGLTARCYRAVRVTLKETASVVKDFAVIGGAYGAVVYFSGPAFRTLLEIFFRSFP